MIEFNGFPAKMQFTPVPNVFFSSILPEIKDINELKLLLHIFEKIYQKKGSLRFISFKELLTSSSFVIGTGDLFREEMRKTLDVLVKKRIIFRLISKQDQISDDIYLLNTRANQLAASKIQAGEIILKGLEIDFPVPTGVDETLDLFTLYEQNIGMLTPLIADELKEAKNDYPDNWIKDAIKEATTQNRRTWRFIARTLELWSTEGKGNGAYWGHFKKDTDPNKYIRGKYGHMVQR